jgi:hypothetical protein
MKKLQLAILLLIVIALFISADYYINPPQPVDAVPLSPSEADRNADEVPPMASPPQPLREALEDPDSGLNLQVLKRARTDELFEMYNLSKIEDLKVFKYQIGQDDTGGQPINVYEIFGPQGQGQLTYLNIKLLIEDQKQEADTINETASLGHNNFFYNSKTQESTAYLVTQISDVVYGFQYSKTDEGSYDSIKTIIQRLMQLLA